MAERVKVFEEQKKAGIPFWAWLLPLLLIIGLLAYFLTRSQAGSLTGASSVAATAPVAGAFPDLGTVHFETDQAVLTPADQATLDRAAAAMQSNPAAHMRLEGYTDSSGTDPHNMNLSQQRAYAVANYLKAKGIDGSRLTGEGFGPSNPVDSNATTSGKADNRRVELFSQK